MTAPMHSEDPIARLLVPPPSGRAALDARYRTGRVVSWDHGTQAYAVEIDGETIADPAVLLGPWVASVKPGDAVQVLSTQDASGLSTWIVQGPIGGPDTRPVISLPSKTEWVEFPPVAPLGTGDPFELTPPNPQVVKLYDHTGLRVRVMGVWSTSAIGGQFVHINAKINGVTVGRLTGVGADISQRQSVAGERVFPGIPAGQARCSLEIDRAFGDPDTIIFEWLSLTVEEVAE